MAKRESASYVQVRNIVYNVYYDLIKDLGENAIDNLEKILSEIQKGFKEEQYIANKHWILSCVVELILELYDTIAFGVNPNFNPVIKTRPVTEILNELVAEGKLSKHWFTR